MYPPVNVEVKASGPGMVVGWPEGSGPSGAYGAVPEARGQPCRMSGVITGLLTFPRYGLSIPSPWNLVMLSRALPQRPAAAGSVQPGG